MIPGLMYISIYLPRSIQTPMPMQCWMSSSGFLGATLNCHLAFPGNCIHSSTLLSCSHCQTYDFALLGILHILLMSASARHSHSLISAYELMIEWQINAIYYSIESFVCSHLSGISIPNIACVYCLYRLLHCNITFCECVCMHRFDVFHIYPEKYRVNSDDRI